jgi:hypothetical protein
MRCQWGVYETDFVAGPQMTAMTAGGFGLGMRWCLDLMEWVL